MLRINQQRSADGAKSYFEEGLAREDYYTRDEIVGRWGGRGAARLGLAGDVSRDAFLALCDNLDPNDGKRLTQRTRDGRTVCYDFNFHCPKSLSVLYGLTADPKLLDAFRSAVHETMKEIEAEAQTRVRGGGREGDRETGNLVWAEFVHLTSRPVGGVPDPHLHAHCVVFNATYDAEEQRWKAGQFRDLVRDAPYFEAAFHSRLSKAVSELGYGVERTPKGWEVAGVSRAVVEKFSRRTALIEELARRKGITDAEEKAALGVKSRERKAEGKSREELRAEWRSRLTDAESDELRVVRSARPSARQAGASARDAVEHALADGFERASVVPEKRLLAAALKRGYGTAVLEDVKGAFAARRGIIRQRFEGREMITTRDVLREEAQALAFARDGRGTCFPLGRRNREPDLDGLNPQQQAAVRHVLDATDRVLLIRGAAGTGKTTLLLRAAEAIAAEGRQVHVFAPTGEASRGVLRREGFAEAETVARLLVDETLQARLKGQVMWVDEAGLLGVRDLRRLFEVAERQSARVVLVGDAAQHTAVARGDAFRLLQEHAGLRAAEVNDIVRQRGEYRLAVEALARGDLPEGFARLDRLGAVREVAEEERHGTLARDYLAGVRLGKSMLAVCPTHAEGERVSEAIRAELRAADRLGRTEKTFAALASRGLTEAARADPVSYREGDVVEFSQNVRGGFRKGQRLEVVGHDEAGRVVARTAGGESRTLPLDRSGHFELYEQRELRLAVGDRVRVTRNGTGAGNHGRLLNGGLHTVTGFGPHDDVLVGGGTAIPKGYGHLAHGYVTTSHASQGKTVDRVLVALGDESFAAASAEQFYVSVSRGREACMVYCPDKQELREAVSRSGRRLSATELVQGEAATGRHRRRTLWHGEHTRRASATEAGDANRDSRDSGNAGGRLAGPSSRTGNQR